MQLSVNISSVVFISIMWLSGCSIHKSKDIESPPPGGCAEVNGLEGIDIYLYQDIWQRYYFSGRRINIDNVENPEKLIPEIRRNDFGTNDFEKIESEFGAQTPISNHEKMAYPAQKSPDGRWLLAAIKSPGIFHPTGLVLQSSSNGERIFLSTEWPTSTVQWAPSSDRFAVLEEREDTTPRRPMDFFASIIGHPAGYDDVAISIYQNTGKLICRSILVQKSLEVAQRLVWH